jgi:hypothetical protein
MACFFERSSRMTSQSCLLLRETCLLLCFELRIDTTTTHQLRGPRWTRRLAGTRAPQRRTGRLSLSIASRRPSARTSHDPMQIFFPRRLSCRAVPPPHGQSATQGRSPRRQGRRSGGARTYAGPGSMHALGGRTSVLASFRRGLHGPHRRPDQLQSRQPAPVPCPAADSTPCAGRRCSLAPAETRGGPWAASHRAHCSRRARGARASCPEEAEVVEHDVGAACSHGRRAGATDAAHNRHSRKSQETSMGQFRHFA